MVATMPSVGFALFETTIGHCGIAWGPQGLTGVQLPEGDADATRARMVARFPQAPERAPPTCRTSCSTSAAYRLSISVSMRWHGAWRRVKP